MFQGTRSLLEGLGQEAVLRRGRRVWKLYILAELVGVILLFIPVPAELGTLTIVVLTVAVVIAILGIVAAVDYVGYLGQAAEAVEQAGLFLNAEQE